MHHFLNEKEIRLIELFSSLEYFGSMRDKWEAMIQHVESCLETYMKRLEANYRSKPLPDQPDIVWGHRVLPNFRYTLDQLNKAYILLAHGNTDALGYADNVRSDFKGQLDYAPDWMSKIDQKTYDDNIYRAMSMAHNISITEEARWDCVDTIFHADEFKEFQSFSSPRTYRVNTSISVCSGDKTKITGIYVPDLKNCCPQFLDTHHDAAPLTDMWIGTKDLLDPRTGEKYDEEKIYEQVECTWYLVERTEGEKISDTSTAQSSLTFRVASGQPCPETGFYFTPAVINSRKRFVKGDVMPSLNSTYGQTIWQWDQVQ